MIKQGNPPHNMNKRDEIEKKGEVKNNGLLY